MSKVDVNVIQNKRHLLEASGNFAFYNNKSYRVSRNGESYLIFSETREPKFEPRKAPLEGFVQEVKYNEIDFGYSIFMKIKYRGQECSIIALKENDNVILRSKEKLNNEKKEIRDRDSYVTEVNLADAYFTIMPVSGRAFNLPTESEYESKRRNESLVIFQLKQYLDILNIEIDKVEDINLSKQEISRIKEDLESLLGEEKIKKYKKVLSWEFIVK